MSFRIRLEAPLGSVPAAVRKKLQAVLESIAQDLESLRTGGPLFESLSRSGLVVDVRGWRFGYRIDGDDRSVVVESALALK